jgi:uncharacterized protein YceK
MTLFHNLIMARAIGVEPIARAMYPDPLDSVEPAFSQATDVPWRARVAAFCLLLALILFAPGPVSAATEKTLFQFPSNGTKGCYPVGSLLRDDTGALYGATFYCGSGGYGTVYKLAPPPPGQTKWSASVIHAFKESNGGAALNGDLVMDAGGALYGTAAEYGAHLQGVVFRLNPPAPGQTQWTETVLHAFYYSLAYNKSDGSSPSAGLVRDANGVLYGTTYYGGSLSDPYAIGYGAVFQLAPPLPGQTNWKETVLYRFQGGSDGTNPSATLALDNSGALYGTTFSGGTGGCTDLFGYVVGCGTVFKLTPPAPGGTKWTKTTLHQFGGGADGESPLGKLFLDGAGSVYGTTVQGGNGQCGDGIGNVVGCGTVFKLMPPAPGGTVWTKTLIHDFQGVPDGTSPQGGLIADAGGNLIGTTFGGGSGACSDLYYRNVGCGTVYKLTAPPPGQTAWTETVTYNFQGLADGWEPIGELVSDPTGKLYGANQLGGVDVGYGTVFQITP